MQPKKRIFNLPQFSKQKTELRNNATSAEEALWLLLKGRQLQGRKFRRQHSIGPYIADFYCPEEQLIIELDGEYHNNTEQKEYDRNRDEYLSCLGLIVLRVTNNMVFTQQAVVLQMIANHFKPLT